MTEEQNFILDAAHQLGFEPNDDLTHWTCSSEQLVDFVERAVKEGRRLSQRESSNVHPLDQLEPAALCDTAMLPLLMDDPAVRMQMSIALSLKRIADTLDGTAAGICVTQAIFGKRPEE